MTTEELKVIISAEISDLKKEVSNAKKEISNVADSSEKASKKMSDTFKKLGKVVAAAFSVKVITDFAKEAVNCAAEVAAEESAFVQIMGEYSDQAAAKVSKIAEATGMVDSRLTPYMTSMTAKFQGLGYNIEEATDYAAQGINMAADAAAFWDMSLEESTSHLNSFINGSYEGGEAIGLFANDTQMALYAVEQGIVADTKAWSSLDEATKQATRLEYAQNMMTTSGVIGQAAKESDQYANVQANLTEKWRQFLAQVGTPILQNIVIPAMSALSAAVDVASVAFTQLQIWVGSVRDTLQQATEWCNQHQTALTLIGIAIGTVTAAIIAYNVQAAIQAAGGIAQVASLAATTVGYYALTAAETVATAAGSAFAAVMAFITSPVTLVIAAIGALIAIIVLCVKHWDEIKATVLKVVEVIKQAVSAMVEAVVGFFTDLWNKIVAIVNSIKDGVTAGFNTMKTAVLNVFNGIKTGITTVINGIKNTVSSVFNAIKDTMVNGVTAAKNTVLSIFDGIKNGISNAINTAKNVVGSAIDAIKGFFKFEWSLPKLKLPHISITGSFSLMPPSVPKFGIDWYAQGGVFDSPTLFNYSGGLGGLGEDGAEAVVPLEKNTKWLDRIAERLGGGNRPIILQVDGKTFGQISIDSINQLTRQTGKLGLRLT